MKTILCLMLAIASLNLNAQNKIVQSFFDNVPESEEIFRLEISGTILKLALGDEDEGEKNLFQKIKAIRLMGADQSSDVPHLALGKLTRDLKSSTFEPLAEFRDGGDKVEFMIRENDKYISDFIAKIQDNEGGFFFISIEGNFSYDDIQGLDLDIDGLDHLKKLPKDRKELPRA